MPAMSSNLAAGGVALSQAAPLACPVGYYRARVLPENSCFQADLTDGAWPREAVWACSRERARAAAYALPS